MTTAQSDQSSAHPALVAPSILAADWAHLAQEVERVQAAGADWLHVDVMDGHFVPALTFGPQMVRTLKKVSSLPLDVHLMIDNPEAQIESFADAGADYLTVHVEVCPHLHRMVQRIHELGKKAGVAINPGTSLSHLDAILPEIDLVLIMSVNPGWGGQKFIESSLGRISQISEKMRKLGRDVFIEVDGGINDCTSAQVRGAGANVLVAGTFVFGEKDYGKQVKALKA